MLRFCNGKKIDDADGIRLKAGRPSAESRSRPRPKYYEKRVGIICPVYSNCRVLVTRCGSPCSEPEDQLQMTTDLLLG